MRRAVVGTFAFTGRVDARLVGEFPSHLSRTAARGSASGSHIAVRNGLERHRAYNSSGGGSD
jgi:hypothetical protein